MVLQQQVSGPGSATPTPSSPPPPPSLTGTSGGVSADQLVYAAQQAGFTGQGLLDAVAVALGESGGNPRFGELNNNPATGDYSVSPWQINYFQSLGPARTAQFGSPQSLEDNLGAAAKAAYAISGGGTNWSPWTTWGSGIDARYMQEAQNMVQQAGNNPSGTGAASAALGAGMSNAQAGQQVTNTAYGGQLALGGLQQQYTNQQLQQQLQNTMSALGLTQQAQGIQKTGLQQQGQYQQGEYGLSVQGINEALANLTSQYGFQQQQQQGQLNASGLTNSGTASLEKAQAAQGYEYGKEGYANQLAGANLSNTYQQQQLANSLAQLGIQGQQTALQGKEAQQQYQTGTQESALQLADLANQTVLQEQSSGLGIPQQALGYWQSLLTAGQPTGGY